MKALGLLAALGVGLVVVATMLGGKPVAIGGGVAVIAQLWAVALLRPKMRAPNPEFMARWLGGMGIRVLGIGVVLIVSATLPALLGYLGVLLPLLFLETRFLRWCYSSGTTSHWPVSVTAARSSSRSSRRSSSSFCTATCWASCRGGPRRPAISPSRAAWR